MIASFLSTPRESSCYARITDACSFGRSCLIDNSFCPRSRNSLHTFTSNAHGRDSKKLQNNAPREAGAASGAFASTVLVTCSQSLTKEICE